MQGERSAKWILIISIIMFFASLFYGQFFFYQGSSGSFGSIIWLTLGRVNTLLFLVTITVGALFTTSFAKKELAYKLTLYFFVISMGLFFVQFVRILFQI